MIKVGLRAANFPVDEEKQVLLNFFYKHFGGFTFENVSEAFDLAITDKLQIEPKDVKCYENFSCEYLGRILSAYKKYLIQSGRLKSNMDKERQFKPQTNNLLESPKMSNQEIIKTSLDTWKLTNNWRFIMVDCYQSLVDEGKLNLLTEVKIKLQKIAAGIIKQDLETDINYHKGNNLVDIKIMYAKKLAVAEYFKTL